MRSRLILVAMLTALLGPAARAADRPNILWITSEDNSPYLGCYGDPQARTPNLDRLAAEGVRYRNAFSSAPVCSTARSTLILGMRATSLGIHNHRGTVAIPDTIRFYPQLLRDVGYYCTNNAKTDYNIEHKGRRSPTFFWDESGNQAHYLNRAEGQPFFAVFNITTSHEGQTTDQAYVRRREAGLFPEERIVPPEEVVPPPYHPDTPTIRENWSRYYDNLWLMDQRVGELLDELEKAGLADETIVFYFSDHGGALPRGKRNIHDSGTRVPLIIRFPKKYQHFSPVEPGDWVERPVAFVDFAPTLCSLADVPIPEFHEGRAFLGDAAAEPRAHVFLFRGRMDERYDTVRAIRTPEFLYVNNFSPHRSWGQHYSYPFRVLMSMRSWHEEYVAGRCDPIQARYWEPKPGEEFYVIADDPHQIDNRIDDPAYQEEIARLRETLRDEIRATRDAGLLPEGLAERLAGEQTVYEYAQSDAYPIDRVLETATIATSRDASKVEEWIEAMSDPHPAVRYWAATGCLVLKEEAKEARRPLTALLEDPSADVRVVAAEALGHLGATDRAAETLAEAIESGNRYERLAALTAVEMLARAGRLPTDRARELAEGDFPEPLNRVVRWIASLNE